MREAIQRRDGTMAVSLRIDQVKADMARYLRHKAGESFIDIATSDEMDPENVKISVRKGRAMYEAEELLRLRAMKHKSALVAEQIRANAQSRLQEKVVDAIEALIEGEETVPEVDENGHVTFKTYKSLKMIAKGVEQARKVMSLDERPVSNQTVVNIQNNQTVNDAPTQTVRGRCYEDILEGIHEQKRISEGDDAPIDVEATPVEENQQEPETGDEEQLF